METEKFIDLDALATYLEAMFREFIQLEPLQPGPRFKFGAVGVDQGLPRFGVSQGVGNVIYIDSSLENVVAAVILRESIRCFIPTNCLIDITHDAINCFCGLFLETLPHVRVPSFDGRKWGLLLQSHTRTYNAYYLGTPILLELNQVTGGVQFLFKFVHKLRQHAALISPERAADTLVTIVRSVSGTSCDRIYSREQAVFIALFADFMVSHDTFPSLERLSSVDRAWPLARCEMLAQQLQGDVVAPLYMPNPGALNVLFCWVLFETSQAVSHYLARELLFFPFATQSFNQCVGTPVPTYIGVYWLSTSQLDEFSKYLVDLKQKGVLLDYQIFRAEKQDEVVDWNETLNAPASVLLLHECPWDYKTGAKDPNFADSWLVRLAIKYLRARPPTLGAITHLNPKANYGAFLMLIEQATLLVTTDVEKDIAIAFPLLDRFRNVEYVMRLLDRAGDLLRYLFARPDALRRDQGEFGNLAVMWDSFPAHDWLLAHFHSCSVDSAKRVVLLDNIAFATRLLRFFRTAVIPPEEPLLDCLRGFHQALARRIREELRQIPSEEQARYQYFLNFRDEIVRNRIVLPKVAQSPYFNSSVEDFWFIVRTSRTWEELTAGFMAQVAPRVHTSLLVQARDQAGALYAMGIMRATHAQFETFRQGLAGSNGVLGPGASLLVGRRVPFFDSRPVNVVDTFNPATRSYCSIQPYLSLIAAEHLSKWTHPRAASQPYTKKILSAPYLGPIERSSRPVDHLIHVTPPLVTALKGAFLDGARSLHNFAVNNLDGRWTCDLNWPAYGLDRYFLHVYLSTRNPRYIYSHLVTPATRRVLVSSAVSGFQTVLIEYLWPRNAPDDKFLQYLYTRTEKNVLAYSVHRVVSSTRFFNLDKVAGSSGRSGEELWDDIDLIFLTLARAQDSGHCQATEFPYGGETRHIPGSVGWEMAAGYFAGSSRTLPPDSRPVFEFDSRRIGFSEKTALFFRGDFDALPLCQALPFGDYYRTEEVAFESPERLVGQLGHIILFDFPFIRATQVDQFLDDLLRNPAVTNHRITSYLTTQPLKKIMGVRLELVNPLRANPYDPRAGNYYHLPKRILHEGKWYTIPLKEQAAQLRQSWGDSRP